MNGSRKALCSALSMPSIPCFVSAIARSALGGTDSVTNVTRRTICQSDPFLSRFVPSFIRASAQFSPAELSEIAHRLDEAEHGFLENSAGAASTNMDDTGTHVSCLSLLLR